MLCPICLICSTSRVSSEAVLAVWPFCQTTSSTSNFTLGCVINSFCQTVFTEDYHADTDLLLIDKILVTARWWFSIARRMLLFCSRTAHTHLASRALLTTKSYIVEVRLTFGNLALFYVWYKIKAHLFKCQNTKPPVCSVLVKDRFWKSLQKSFQHV